LKGNAGGQKYATYGNQYGQQFNNFLHQDNLGPGYGPMAPMQPQLLNSLPHNDVVAQRPTEFVFQHHFDENGALFFLGSYGKRRLYQNPHTLGQVQAFSSSIG
jgi:hypothetical protein